MGFLWELSGGSLDRVIVSGRYARANKSLPNSFGPFRTT
jgi:hypothetical protein